MGTTAEKLAYLKESKEQIKNALETPSNVMRDYANLIKKYVDNQPTSIVTDGVCTNALDVPLVSMGVDGNSEQKQYEGKNLIDLKTLLDYWGATYTVENDIYTITDIGTGYTNPYQFSEEDIVVSCQGLIKNITSTNARLACLNSSGNFYTVVSENQKNRENISVCKIRLDYNSKGTFTLSNIQLEKGTVATDYEPYVGGQPSPNPEYPQDIETVDGCNMIDMSKAIKNYYINEASGAALSVPSSYNAFATDFIKVNQGDYIYYSGYKNTNRGNTGAYYDKDKNYLGKINRDVDIAPFIVPEGCKFIRLSIWGKNYEIPTNPKPVLVKGTTPKPYLPHGCIGLEQSGKNKANINNIPNSSIINIVNNTITLANNSSGIGYIGTSITLKQLCPNLKIDDEVILTFDNTSSSPFNDVIYLDGINEKWNKNTSKTITQTILDSKIILYGGYNEIAIISNFMIRLSSTNDTYEPYHSPKLYPINLNGNSLAKVGDVKDLLKIYRNGDVEIGTKKTNRYYFTGNENWMSYEEKDTYDYHCYFCPAPENIIQLQDVLGLLISTHFIEITWDNIYAKRTNTQGIALRNNKRFYVRVNQSNVTEWKSYLAEQYANGTPVYVDYVLEIPETIKLPPIDPIELWEGTNKFELITNLDTTFEMEYVVNKDYLETQNLLNIVEGENI